MLILLIAALGAANRWLLEAIQMVDLGSRPSPRRRAAGWRSTALAAATAIAVSGGAAAANFDTPAEYVYLYDVTAGAVLMEKNADKLMAPASMSKLMTLEVLFSHLKQGQAKLDDEVVISEHAWRTGGGPSGTSSILAVLNSRVPLSELMLGVIVQSGNDACIAIAEHLAGSEEAFARTMTEQARKLGMARSTFANSTGLPHNKQMMTARELAILALHLMDAYPDYYRYFTEKVFEFRGRKFINRNPVLTMNIGGDGLKTGQTEASGFGLVGSAMQNGRRLLLVVNGLKSNEERTAEVRKLFEWGFKNFQEAEIFGADEVVGEARVWGGSSLYVPLVGNGPVKVLVPRFSTTNKLKGQIVYQGPLKPPIKRGDKVAKLRVENSEGGMTEVPLVAGADVDRGSVFVRGFDSLMHLTFGWVPL